MKSQRIVVAIFVLVAMPTLVLAQTTASPIGSSQESTAKMPEFSWNTLPLYAHVRKATKFTPEQLKHLATFPLITLEKTRARETATVPEEAWPLQRPGDRRWLPVLYAREFEHASVKLDIESGKADIDWK